MLRVDETDDGESLVTGAWAESLVQCAYVSRMRHAMKRKYRRSPCMSRNEEGTEPKLRFDVALQKMTCRIQSRSH
jgi:hypothetical protein